MPFNGIGVWSNLFSWVNQAANGVPISAPNMDSQFNDIASAGFDNCVTRDGQGAPTALIPFSSGLSTNAGIKFPTAGTGTSTNANTLDAYQEGTFTFVDTSGQNVPINNRNCTYVLIGNTCFISAACTFGSSAVATAAAWNGLPFTVKNINGNGAIGMVYGRFNICVIPEPGNTFVRWFTTAGVVVNDSDISTLDLRFQFNYTIA